MARVASIAWSRQVRMAKSLEECLKSRSADGKFEGLDPLSDGQTPSPEERRVAGSKAFSSWPSHRGRGVGALAPRHDGHSHAFLVFGEGRDAAGLLAEADTVDAVVGR